MQECYEGRSALEDRRGGGWGWGEEGAVRCGLRGRINDNPSLFPKSTEVPAEHRRESAGEMSETEVDGVGAASEAGLSWGEVGKGVSSEEEERERGKEGVTPLLA